MKPLPHTLLALVLLGVGLWVGRALFSRGDDPSSVAHESTGTMPPRHSSPAPPRGGVPGGDGGKHDYASLNARYDWQKPQSATERRELARLSPAALKALALEQLPLSRVGGMSPEALSHFAVFNAALEELYHREGVAALEWAAALEDKDARSTASRNLLCTALRQHPESAMPWVRRYCATDGNATAMTVAFLSDALPATVQRGADEVIKLCNLFGEDTGGSQILLADYPPDFDFAKVDAALAGKVHLGEMYSQWAAQDKDAAWLAVKPKMTTGGPIDSQYFDSLLLGATAKEGEAAAATWAVERLAELSPEQRTGIVKHLNERFDLTAESVSVLSRGLDLPDRKTFAEAMLSQNLGSTLAIAALEGLPRQDLIELLGSRSSMRNAKQISAEARSRFALTPEEMERIGGGK